MNIVIIGSGNVATHLAKALQQANHVVNQVFSRRLANAKKLADRVDAVGISTMEQLDTTADLYIISVKDDVISEVIEKMPQVDGLVVHTAGSIAMDSLERFEKYGVFYPFQTFTKQTDIDFAPIPILVEADNKENTALLFNLGKQLSEQVLRADSQQRGHLHIAAVFACNFVNHMYRLANEVLETSLLPFDLLHPLIKETAAKVQKVSPAQTQTGPASRKDYDVINKHMEALSSNPELSKLYQELTNSVIRRVD